MVENEHFSTVLILSNAVSSNWDLEGCVFCRRALKVEGGLTNLEVQDMAHYESHVRVQLRSNYQDLMRSSFQNRPRKP